MAVTLNSASFLYYVGDILIPRLAWARNIVFLDLQADAAWATNDSYYIELEIGIFDINNLSFNQLGKSLIEEPNFQGRLNFEIQQIMQDYEGINIPVPDFNATQIVQHTTPTFYVKIFEVVNNVKTQILLEGMTGGIALPENTVLPASSYRIDTIDAALDRENFTYEQQYEWIFGEVNEGGRKFLTSVEDPKSTTKTANEFLYWFGSMPNRNLEVYCKIQYDDNTEETVTLFPFLAGYNIQCIPTRYDLIKAKSTQPTKNIIAWGVYAGYNTFRVSEYFRYELNEQQNREARYFLAKNSLGVFDTLVCQGDYEEFLESESETASKRDFANYAITDAQKFIVSKTGKRGGNANTAFLNKLQSVVKQDFVLSREMLLQGEKGFIPIIAEKTKHVYSIKNNNLIGYSFEYAHAHNVKDYTNKIFRPILGEVPTPPTLPKFTIRNTGEGYVRVEYDTTTIDVAPNSEESIEIEENISVKVTWGIVDLDTGLLDASTIDISYPNYKFPARIDIATFDSVVQEGSPVVGISDQNNVKKARSFTLTMPNNDYFAEIKFRELALLYDFDFENPSCLKNSLGNNVAIDESVAILSDRIATIPSIAQTTPSLRGLRKNGYLELVNGRYYAEYPQAFETPGSETDGRKPTSFFVAKPKAVGGRTDFITAIRDPSNYMYGAQEHGYTNNYLYINYRTLYNNTFSPVQTAFNAGQLNKNYLAIIKPYYPKFRIGGIWYSKNSIQWYHPFCPSRGLGFGAITGASLSIDFYRLLAFAYTEPLTTEEENLISDKCMSKYNIL